MKSVVMIVYWFIIMESTGGLDNIYFGAAWAHSPLEWMCPHGKHWEYIFKKFGCKKGDSDSEVAGGEW